MTSNGSPLVTGGAGSGESDIRKWIIENDWLEAIIALPEQMFYNTGIGTYIWIVTNRKEARRRGKIQLLDARQRWKPMRRSLGDKRRELGDDDIAAIVKEHGRCKETATSKIFDNTDFGYRRVTVERPLRDESGDIVMDKKGKPTPDAKLRDCENVPLKEDVDSYFQREVLPHVPDAWMDRSKDKVGYEINSNRHFYRYTPPRPLEGIDADLKQAEEEILRLLRGVSLGED